MFQFMTIIANEIPIGWLKGVPRNFCIWDFIGIISKSRKGYIRAKEVELLEQKKFKMSNCPY